MIPKTLEGLPKETITRLPVGITEATPGRISGELPEEYMEEAVEQSL